jgi:hypothetical protein
MRGVLRPPVGMDAARLMSAATGANALADSPGRRICDVEASRTAAELQETCATSSTSRNSFAQVVSKESEPIRRAPDSGIAQTLSSARWSRAAKGNVRRPRTTPATQPAEGATVSAHQRNTTKASPTASRCSQDRQEDSALLDEPSTWPGLRPIAVAGLPEGSRESVYVGRK